MYIQMWIVSGLCAWHGGFPYGNLESVWVAFGFELRIDFAVLHQFAGESQFDGSKFFIHKIVTHTYIIHKIHVILAKCDNVIENIQIHMWWQIFLFCLHKCEK